MTLPSLLLAVCSSSTFTYQSYIPLCALCILVHGALWLGARYQSTMLSHIMLNGTIEFLGQGGRVPVNTGTDSKILERLEEWEEKEGALPKSLEFYRGLLRIQSEARSRVGVLKLGLTEKAIGNRIRHGSPLLGFDDLSVDWSLLRNIFKEVTALFTSYSEVLGEIPKNLEDTSSCLALLKEATKAWFEGAQLPPRMRVSGVNEALLELMLHAALRPFLITHCEALLSFVNQECPYCGTQDQGALAYFTDDEGLYRLYLCEQCRHYLKAIDLRQAECEVLLPLERFLTLDLDTQAHQDGYTPCAKARGDEGMKRPCGTTLLAMEKS